MGKAIQCPACGRKHRVGTLPDAPTFQCEGCGKGLKVPAQFRPSVMTSPRDIRPPNPEARPSSTAVLPKQAPAAAAPSAPAAARGAARARPPVVTTAAAGPALVALPLRILAWVAALVIGLLVTGWIARVSGWLSGDRLVDVFTGTGGMERYLRVLALAPAWALATTLLLTAFLEGGRALARRRNANRAEREPSSRGEGRSSPRTVDASLDEVRRDPARGDGHRSRREAPRRAGPEE